VRWLRSGRLDFAAGRKATGFEWKRRRLPQGEGSSLRGLRCGEKTGRHATPAAPAQIRHPSTCRSGTEKGPSRMGMALESYRLLRLLRDPANHCCGPQARCSLLNASSQSGHRDQRLRAGQFLPLLEYLPHLRHLESSVGLGWPTRSILLVAFQKPNFGKEIHSRHEQNKALML